MIDTANIIHPQLIYLDWAYDDSATVEDRAARYKLTPEVFIRVLNLGARIEHGIFTKLMKEGVK